MHYLSSLLLNQLLIRFYLSNLLEIIKLVHCYYNYNTYLHWCSEMQWKYSVNPITFIYFNSFYHTSTPHYQTTTQFHTITQWLYVISTCTFCTAHLQNNLTPINQLLSYIKTWNIPLLSFENSSQYQLDNSLAYKINFLPKNKTFS